MSLSRSPMAGGSSIQNLNKLSSFNSSIPTFIFFTRSRSFSLNVKAQYMTPQEQQHQKQRVSAYESPSPSQPGQLPPKVYVGYSVYKGKAALTVDPHPPEFSPLDSGAFKLSKEGFVLLQFAPASGVRQYDWGRKQARLKMRCLRNKLRLKPQLREARLVWLRLTPQVFSLSVTEIGNIISLGAKDSCEFFHDPFKGKSDEGRVRKILKVEPLPDGSGHFFNLSVQNKLMNLDESIYIPITRAEFAVLVSSFNFIIPYLLGWHTFANGIKPEDANRANNANPRSSGGADFEWSR